MDQNQKILSPKHAQIHLKNSPKFYCENSLGNSKNLSSFENFRTQKINKTFQNPKKIREFHENTSRPRKNSIPPIRIVSFL